MDVRSRTFGLAHPKREGAPAHPEDVMIHCGCETCEICWQRQLEAYNTYYDNKNEEGK